MSSHRITLVRQETVAADTLAFAFDKPPGFTFKAGQAVDLTLVDPPESDAKGSRRAFSIVSAPHAPELVVATRARDSAFKRVLRALPHGAPVELDGPFGSLTLHGDRSRPAVFIAGGIGITPFMSIIKQALHDDLPQVMTLLYSNRRPQDAAFLEELLDLECRHRGRLFLVPTMTEATGINGWSGRVGMIDAGMIRGIMVAPSRPVYYVVGPPGMVAGMRGVLNGMGVEDDDIRSEDFAGY
jgi:ferredoxin-NADP reductase